MKIFHVTESLAAGVGHYVSLVAQAQTAAGHDVVLAHSVREDTPDEAMLQQLYAGLNERIVVPMVTPVSSLRDLMSTIALMQLMRRIEPDVIHLHSSKAGVLGRLAARVCNMQDRVFYSPHGFAFLREDVSPKKQRLFLLFERVAAKMGGRLVACSVSEAMLAKEEVRHPQVCLVENATDLSKVPQSTGVDRDDVLVLNAGRVCYQKAPWRFKYIADECASLPARFVWMGCGDLESTLTQGNNPTNLNVTGWLPRDDVMQHLSQGGLYLMPSLWEGMPLALIEAQAAGLPAVVSDVVGNRDVVIDGVTGFVCKTDEALLEKTRLLVEDAKLRCRMGRAARELAMARFSVDRMHREMMAVYNNTYV